MTKTVNDANGLGDTEMIVVGGREQKLCSFGVRSSPVDNMTGYVVPKMEVGSERTCNRLLCSRLCRLKKTGPRTGRKGECRAPARLRYEILLTFARLSGFPAVPSDFHFWATQPVI